MRPYPQQAAKVLPALKREGRAATIINSKGQSASNSCCSVCDRTRRARHTHTYYLFYKPALKRALYSMRISKLIELKCLPWTAVPYGVVKH